MNDNYKQSDDLMSLVAQPLLREPIRIFSSEVYKIECFLPAGPAEAVAITFTERGNHRLDGFGYGKGFMLKHACALIAIKSCQNYWYQDFSHEALYAVVAFLNTSNLKYLPRATYGSSMGAYAAIAFSGPLGAAVLAMSPPSDIKQFWDPRWRDDIPIFRPIASYQNHHNRIIIVYDPYDLDGKHAQAIAQTFPQAVHVQVPFAGHSTAEELQNMDCLKSLALAVIRGDALPNIGQTIKNKRRAGQHYYFVLASHCRDRRKFCWGYNLVVRALIDGPLNPEYRILASALALSNGRHIEAIEHAAMAASLDPTHHGMQYHLGQLLNQAGNMAGALAATKRAVSLFPESSQYTAQCNALEETFKSSRDV